ncbi:hypothetical protein [Methyloceanibacter methanicus]|uniref:hypothetical protein n=1 Tax=Methyloceanibacter methanicus TaxID=1774968 RepID=UPI00114C8A43|nr:hypothetical protein [Methyloceanibacter methanicus]
MFKLYLKPFGTEPPDAPEFYELFGRCAVLWGRLDSTLEYVLVELAALPSAADIRPREIPVSFKRKIKLWRKLYQTLPEVSGRQSRALKFADDAVALSQKRNPLIHAVIGFSGSDTAASGIHYKQDGPRTLYRRFKVEKKDLETLLIETNNLLQRLAPFTLHAWSQGFQPETQPPSSEPAEK